MTGRNKEELNGVNLLGNQKNKYPTDYAPEMLESFQMCIRDRGAGVAVRADDQLAGSGQTFFREQRMLDAHCADVEEMCIRDRLFLSLYDKHYPKERTRNHE